MSIEEQITMVNNSARYRLCEDGVPMYESGEPNEQEIDEIIISMFEAGWTPEQINQDYTAASVIEDVMTINTVSHMNIVKFDVVVYDTINEALHNNIKVTYNGDVVVSIIPF